ncbi:hypothetical protein DPMN_084305 [Dreissena polymorpha]|uniref:Uncharacterized protein n=1 Tax=Dreissena polymorpha TaxID=45954 RepID=A0A9D3YEB1_DREPO|nr:hypothetical protein DPMN_084305 [Dreissena polymorpha]
MEELTNIHTQLEARTKGIGELREDLKSVLKREEIEELIKNTVSTIMKKIKESMLKQFEHEVKNRTNTFKEQIAGLEFENGQLKQTIVELKSSTTKSITELETQVGRLNDTIREALKLANYNEQYSRKNNVKILNITESSNETETSLTQTVSNIIKTTADVELKPEDIIAIHRIPTKKGCNSIRHN